MIDIVLKQNCKILPNNPPNSSKAVPPSRVCATNVVETSCKKECEAAKIAIYSVYYTKYPEQKWRRSIAKDVDLLNFRR
jgi:hypothetical protein